MPNRNGNDGTVSRFGWKAQNKSLEVFSGEAYNVEMGITNELFTNERASPDEVGLPANCRLNSTPEDATDMTAIQTTGVPSDTVGFSMFMRLAGPADSVHDRAGRSKVDRRWGAYLHADRLRALPHTDDEDRNIEPSRRA